MADVGSLIESAQARGLRLFLEGDKVKIRAPQALDGETKAIIQELRQHREEVLEALAQEDPVLSVDVWLPEYLTFRKEVYRQVKDTNIWGYARTEKPELYIELKKAEARIDNLSSARLSEVMELLRQWQGVMLQIKFEQQRI